MWSTKKNLATWALFSVTALLLTACQFSGVKGSGKVVTQNRMVPEAFKTIIAAKGLDVVLEQSNATGISVVADDNLQSHIKTTVSNGVLKITSDINNYINVESKQIVVKAPNIESIEVWDGASFESKNTIKSKAIALKVNTGASLKISIECEKATIETATAGAIEIEGKAISLETAAASGSSIDAQKLLSNDIIASASTAGNINVNPLVSLNADAATGGTIHYFNVPKNLNKKSTTGGSISKK
jgi:hypothetical protein